MPCPFLMSFINRYYQYTQYTVLSSRQNQENVIRNWKIKEEVWKREIHNIFQR